MKIQRALISVSDKTGLVEFARGLAAARRRDHLDRRHRRSCCTKEGVASTEISAFTGFPEMMDGRVKTLHPKVHGGLLYLRDNPEHVAQAKEHGIQPIDLVVVNLYPFEKTIAKAGTTLEEAIEQIDIGGPSMLRSAAKNYRSVTVVVDPADYADVLETHGGQRRRDDAQAARTARDQGLRHHLEVRRGDRELPEQGAGGRVLPFPSRCRSSRACATARTRTRPPRSTAHSTSYFEKLHGKELSYNNILDITAASELIDEFSEPTVAILKHTNPCGVGSDPDLREAWDKAFATDKQAPFGGIIICNRPLTVPLARAISEIFSEVIIAPDFEADARALLQKKKNLRLMKKLAASAADFGGGRAAHPLRRRWSARAEPRSRAETWIIEIKVVTKRKPTKRRNWRPCSSPGAW